MMPVMACQVPGLADEDHVVATRSGHVGAEGLGGRPFTPPGSVVCFREDAETRERTEAPDWTTSTGNGTAAGLGNRAILPCRTLMLTFRVALTEVFAILS